jgi:hypothetical protein
VVFPVPGNDCRFAGGPTAVREAKMNITFLWLRRPGLLWDTPLIGGIIRQYQQLLQMVGGSGIEPGRPRMKRAQNDVCKGVLWSSRRPSRRQGRQVVVFPVPGNDCRFAGGPTAVREAKMNIILCTLHSWPARFDPTSTDQLQQLLVLYDCAHDRSRHVEGPRASRPELLCLILQKIAD